jgi:hypothetical protein
MVPTIDQDSRVTITTGEGTTLVPALQTMRARTTMLRVAGRTRTLLVLAVLTIVLLLRTIAIRLQTIVMRARIIVLVLRTTAMCQITVATFRARRPRISRNSSPVSIRARDRTTVVPRRIRRPDLSSRLVRRKPRRRGRNNPRVLRMHGRNRRRHDQTIVLRPHRKTSHNATIRLLRRVRHSRLHNATRVLRRHRNANHVLRLHRNARLVPLRLRGMTSLPRMRNRLRTSNRRISAKQY